MNAIILTCALKILNKVFLEKLYLYLDSKPSTNIHIVAVQKKNAAPFLCSCGTALNQSKWDPGGNTRVSPITIVSIPVFSAFDA
jgi:hypothetical protein